jgi:hypothetical protein
LFLVGQYRRCGAHPGKNETVYTGSEELDKYFAGRSNTKQIPDEKTTLFLINS